MGKKGFSIIELMISTLLIITILSAGLLFNENLRKNIQQVLTRQYAVGLALSQIDDLERLALTDYLLMPGVLDTNNPHAATPHIAELLQAGYSLSYSVQNREYDSLLDLTGQSYHDYKIICVTVSFSDGCSVQMNSLVIKPVWL